MLSLEHSHLITFRRGVFVDIYPSDRLTLRYCTKSLSGEEQLYGRIVICGGLGKIIQR